MRNLKQNLFSKTFAAAITLLMITGFCLAGLARQERALLSAKAQGEKTAEPTQERSSKQELGSPFQSTFPRQRVCSVGSLQGNYAETASASVIPGGFSPAVCAGMYSFDGKGNIIGKDSHSFNGQIIPEANYTGTYTLNSNCTGTMVLKSVELGIVTTQNFVVTEDDKEIFYVVTDEGVVSSGTMKKM